MFCVPCACASDAPPPPRYSRARNRAPSGVAREEDRAFANEQLSIVGDELARRAIETKQAGRDQQAQARERWPDRLQAGRGAIDRARRSCRRPHHFQSPGRAELRRVHRAPPGPIRAPAGAQRHAGSRFTHRPFVLGRFQAARGLLAAQRRAGRHGVHVVRRYRLPAPHQRPGRILRRRSRDRALWTRDPPRHGGRREFRLPAVGRSFHRFPAAHESGAGAPARRPDLQGSQHGRRVEERA